MTNICYQPPAVQYWESVIRIGFFPKFSTQIKFARAWQRHSV